MARLLNANRTEPVLTELDHVPDGLLEREATALHHHLPGPTLIHLEGRVKRPIVVGVLQHGNETTGWEAIRRLLKSHYERDQLPRSLKSLLCHLTFLLRNGAHNQIRTGDPVLTKNVLFQLSYVGIYV